MRSDIIQAVKNAQQDAIQQRQARRIQVDTAATNPTLNIGALTYDTGGNPVFTGTPQVLGGEANRNGQITLTAYTVLPNGTKKPQSPPNSLPNIAFNYQGIPTDRDSLPFVITISGGPGTTQQCVIVANLLGNVKTANGTECNNPRVGLN